MTNIPGQGEQSQGSQGRKGETAFAGPLPVGTHLGSPGSLSEAPMLDRPHGKHRGPRSPLQALINTLSKNVSHPCSLPFQLQGCRHVWLSQPGMDDARHPRVHSSPRHRNSLTQDVILPGLRSPAMHREVLVWEGVSAGSLKAHPAISHTHAVGAPGGHVYLKSPCTTVVLCWWGRCNGSHSMSLSMAGMVLVSEARYCLVQVCTCRAT